LWRIRRAPPAELLVYRRRFSRLSTLVRRRFSLLCLFAAWLCASGAVLDVVQVFAWGRMFTAYARTMSLTQATEETMDASKPCAICLAVRRARDSERHEQPVSLPQTAERLLLAYHAADMPVLVRTEAVEWTTTFESRPVFWCEDVPVPPPRAGQVSSIG
jgi:hypothetical protein